MLKAEQTLPRQGLVWLLLALLLVSVLQGCGWRLRGASMIDLQLPPVYLDAGGIGQQLRLNLERGLKSSGVTLAAGPQDAGLILKLHNELTERRVMTVDNSGKVKEYELQYSVQFALVDGKGEVVQKADTIRLRRDYKFDEADVLAKNEEQEQLFAYMRNSAVQNILRRLQRVAENLAQESAADQSSEEAVDQGGSLSEPRNAD